MPRRILLLLLAVLLPAPYARGEDAESASGAAARQPHFKVERLMGHVKWLAAPARKGRLGWKERKASSEYIAQHFLEAGLQPLPGMESMFRDTPGVKEPALRNVMGWLPVGEQPTAEYVIISAHYDHLGEKVLETKVDDVTVRRTQTFVGADDNATGVAALLELARHFGALYKQNPKAFSRSLLFVSFDLEEPGLRGSRRFVAQPPLPLAGCTAFVTMDMLGRSIADLVAGGLFIMGTENAAALADVVAGLPDPAKGRKIVLGIDFQPGASDYEPFRAAKVPYIFLTSGACGDYHRPTDTPDKIEGPHLAARTDWIRRLLDVLLAAGPRPVWRDGVEPSVTEIETLRDTIAVVEKRLPDVSGMPPMAALMIKNFGIYLGKVLEDGEVTERERTSARNTAMNLFKVAVSLAGP